jgi:hypothetical protein
VKRTAVPRRHAARRHFLDFFSPPAPDGWDDGWDDGRDDGVDHGVER